MHVFLLFISGINVPSVIKIVPHRPGILIPKSPQAYIDLLSDPDKEMEDEGINDKYQILVESHQPKSFGQAELNDQTRDFGLV